MIRLKLILRRIGADQKALAAHLGVSRAKVAQWLNHDQWPRQRDSAAMRQSVADWLQAHGALPEERAHWWQPLPAAEAARHMGAARGRGRRRGVRDTSEAGGFPAEQEDTIMLLRGQKLTEEARRQFGLFRDPFRGEIREHEDLYLTPDMRYCREGIWQTALHGGMTAIVGESGSGKTTLREDVHDRIERSGEPIVSGELVATL